MKLVWILFLLLLMPIVFADTADLDGSLSSEDKAKFDQILEPVMKIYNFVKYISSVVAAIFLLYAGITYMTSGGDPKQRDQAKSIAGYVVIGLMIIWAVPIIVGVLV